MSALPRTYEGKTAVVVGAGATGKAACRLLRRQGAQVRLLDRNLKPDEIFDEWAAAAGIEMLSGEHSREQFAGADLVVPSPGIPPKTIEAFLPDPAPEVIAEMELAWRLVEQPILAITGTNGKTTTATLAAHVIEHTGWKVFLGGNIGTPLSEYVLSEVRADILVLEVSSFQLMGCRKFRPRSGVFLNFSPNHLDYHLDLEEYLAAKLKLFANQEEGDLAVVPEELLELLGGREDFRRIRSRVVAYRPRGRFHCPSLPGGHNQANMEAAYQACRYFGITEKEMHEALRNFRGLPHRIESIGEVRGVRFVNDSKATTVEAVRAALQSVQGPVRLLVGGVYKGGDFRSLLPDMRGKVQAVGLFGAGREVFTPAFEGEFPLSWDETLEQAVRRLFADARPGDTILLSPGTSSFDLYTDYKARGKDFLRIMEALG